VSRNASRSRHPTMLHTAVRANSETRRDPRSQLPSTWGTDWNATRSSVEYLSKHSCVVGLVATQGIRCKRIGGNNQDEGRCVQASLRVWKLFRHRKHAIKSAREKSPRQGATERRLPELEGASTHHHGWHSIEVQRHRSKLRPGLSPC
jgi:hypothetical protein